jgi:RNA polymerase sporulation-specific sigma factor
MREEQSDEELICAVRRGNREAEELLLKKYSPMVKKEIRFLYIVGAETEDLAQEGMIGLVKAIRDYDTSGSARFHTFATICVRNQIKSAITASQRKKHIPLNTSISIDGDDHSEEEKLSLEQAIGDLQNNNPEQLLLEEEKKREMYAKLEEKLSSFEKKVVELYLQGLSYADIAEAVGKEEKAVSNALNRIRRKLK